VGARHVAGPAILGAALHVLAQEVAGAQVHEAEVVDDVGTLRALARAQGLASQLKMGSNGGQRPADVKGTACEAPDLTRGWGGTGTL